MALLNRSQLILRIFFLLQSTILQCILLRKFSSFVIIPKSILGLSLLINVLDKLELPELHVWPLHYPYISSK